MALALGFFLLSQSFLVTAMSIQQKPSLLQTQESQNLPLIFWHGLGDSYDSDGMQSLTELVNKSIGPTYSYYVRQNDDAFKDRTATFLGNVTEQIEKACEDIAADPILSAAPAINAVGFSQGGQFVRAYVERCNKPPVANLVTFGAQHNGISEFQPCKSDDWLCQTWEGFLKSNTWTSLAQSTLVPAQYFRDPSDLEPYLENSNFLADVNNEREEKNPTYKANIKKLEKFVMFLFTEDTVVIPPESSYFADVDPETKKVTPLQEKLLYKEDWLGLRALDEQGKLEFKKVEGQHMQFSPEILEDVFKTYFKGHDSGSSASDRGNGIEL